MSRIGKKIIIIPANVKVSINGNTVKAAGTKGELSFIVNDLLKIVSRENEILLEPKNINAKNSNAIWGTNRQLLNNIIIGVSSGFIRKMEINGVGYKAEVQGSKIILHVGYSHQVNFELPTGVTATIEKNLITLEGIDKQVVGETAARLRKIRRPEPYKGKGIKYLEEIIKRKAGKQVKASSS
jgi:large subunit ribosomal protein L6